MGGTDGRSRGNGTPNAARFIVTVYGDIVEPRGGILWMGSLIEVCRLVGISESLVRTAVSRLVAAGRLEGERHGRRSYYRLTRAGTDEFARAAEMIFGGARPAAGWRLVFEPDSQAAARLEKAGFARIGPGHLIGPDPARLEDTPRASFRVDAGHGDLVAWAQGLWPLEELSDAYAGFLAERGRDVPVAELGAAEALAARLRLVHRWRRIVLDDPHLPAAALPADWPGFAAARAFARRYLALSPASEAAIAELCEARSGAALDPSPAIAMRQAWLEAVPA